MRGKRISTPDVVPFNGITPAGAGKTVFIPVLLKLPQDHPRRCGENDRRNTVEYPMKGSPPQVRGKRVIQWRVVATDRITPAGAGKTRLKPSNSPQRWDHPRRCGENTRLWTDEQTRTGSPPQVRGKPPTWEEGIPVRGITPAGAGKTYRYMFLRWSVSGSPPQVRGKPVSSETVFKRRRITPAGAGKTKVGDPQDAACKDHPRRCGENYHYGRYTKPRRGSPPQVRGKPYYFVSL